MKSVTEPIRREVWDKLINDNQGKSISHPVWTQMNHETYFATHPFSSNQEVVNSIRVGAWNKTLQDEISKR